MTGRRIIVTGGASGLGRAVAEMLRENGDEPIVFDRANASAPNDAEGDRRENVDVTDREAVERAVARANEGGDVDGVITAAGIDRCGYLSEVPAEEWERVIDVNLLGTVGVVRAALPALERSHGHVITVASTLALRVAEGATAYCAAKFGVLGFSRALAAETRGRVGVTTLIPGGMDTHFFDDRPDSYKPPADAKLNRPDDVARAVLFALDQPQGCEVRELVVCQEYEESWP
ncbi:SDR family oxidoreductase [Humibacter albus]|uniref:SDR family oxidoreductase n=1 Tax=Humibacter albus TaxID=427754 RepID=UPI0003B5692E|nr:SDR family oxidoreductase [Humibacter albus]